MTTTLAGIDVSNLQGAAFDWEAYRGKISFAAVKVSEGLDYADPDAARNMAGAKGIGAVRMGYHFLHPSLHGGQQADYFLGLAKKAGLGPGDLVMADVEVTDGCTAAEISACAGLFAATVHAGTGAWPVAYTDQSFAETGCVASLGQCPAFIANPSNVALPSPIGPWRLVSFEQTGQRSVDTDVFYGDLGQLAKLAIPKSAPKPVPVSREQATEALATLALYIAQG